MLQFRTSHRLMMIQSTETSIVGDGKTEKNLRNDLIIRAAKGEKVDRTPIWIYRQAGRHLPEYTAYKKEKNKNFLELLQNPTDVMECTMQPVRRYNVDAAILFSDILVILQALNIEVTMPGGEGIKVPNPIQNLEELIQLLSAPPVDVKQKLSHVIEAVRLIKKELANKVPLIGFSAAPWSLIFYLFGGSSKKNQTVPSEFLKKYPVECLQLFDLMTNIVIDYLFAQIEAGVDLIQIFEAMGEYISEDDFNQWCLPSLNKIVTALKSKYPNIPIMVFPRGAGYAIYDLQKAGYDVVCLDTTANRWDVREKLLLQSKLISTHRSIPCTVQGNLDVTLLQNNSADSKEILIKEVTKLLDDFGPQGLIANLGEGLSGKEDPELVSLFIDTVHTVSEKMIKNL